MAAPTVRINAMSAARRKSRLVRACAVAAVGGCLTLGAWYATQASGRPISADTVQLVPKGDGLHVYSAAPVVTISVLSCAVSRMVPCVIHFSMLATTAGGGRIDQGVVRWVFSGAGASAETWNDPRPGKTSTEYSTLSDQLGFNAACVSRTAGTVTATCYFTNSDGLTSSATTSVTTDADTRTYRYVDETAAAGGDGSQGSPWDDWESDALPWLKLGQARAVLFKRGTSFVNSAANTLTSAGVADQNLLLGAYGSGAKPICDDTQTSTSTMWTFGDCEGVWIEDIAFRGQTTTNPGYCNGIVLSCSTALKHVSAINCEISRCRYGWQNNRSGSISASGVLTLNWTVTEHGSYGYSGSTTDSVHLGPSVTNAGLEHDEHCFRTGGSRCYVESARLDYPANTGANKATLRLEIQSDDVGYCVSRGYFTGGGELPVAWDNGATDVSCTSILFENNYREPADKAAATNSSLQIGANGSGGANVVTGGTIRNNIFYANGTNAAGIAVDLSAGCINTSIIDNTFIWKGICLYAATGATGTVLQRNTLVCLGAPANGWVVFLDSGASFTATDNVWSTQTGTVAYIGGDKTFAQWNAATGVGTDYFQTGLDASDFASNTYIPDSALSVVHGSYTAPTGARTTDYNGAFRRGAAGAADLVPTASAPKTLTLRTPTGTLRISTRGT